MSDQPGMRAQMLRAAYLFPSNLAEGSFVKAPQVGQYTGALRFPRAGGWFVGIRFRDQPSKEFELTDWSQYVLARTN